MKVAMRRHSLISGWFIVLVLLFTTPVMADPVTIEDAWARATPPGARTGAVYLTIRNAGEADRLVAASSHAAGEVQIHTHRHEGGMMKMEQLEALEIPAGGEAVLAPGGDHLMLIGLESGLVDGHSIHIELEFAAAGPLQVTVPVRDARGDP